MKKFLDTLRNIWKIDDLRKRIITTLSLILIYRIGSYVILPGVDPDALSSGGAASGLVGLIDIFAGGAFSRASIFALGIMPYISASIIMQLAGIAIPAIQKLQREGESGRNKINSWTRILTIVICAFQAPTYLATYVREGVIDNSSFWMISAVIILISGSMFVVWLGERITERGVGNGVSLLIMIGIIANLPRAFAEEAVDKMSGNGGPIFLLVEIAILLLVIIFTILLVQGTRRIPIQHAKRIVGRGAKQMQVGGQRQYLPLKVNAAGVMPIIFAQAIMIVPSFAFANTSFGATFSNIQGFWYNFTLAFMIIIFTYFYTAVTVNPNQIADELKRSGGFIPGVKPGKKTSEYIDNLLSRITLPGSIFLAFIAILPAFAMILGVKQSFALFYGGTSLLIMVGVVLDTLQQIESHLLSRHYDGLMKGGKIKGRGSNMPAVGQAI